MCVRHIVRKIAQRVKKNVKIIAHMVLVEKNVVFRVASV